MENKYIIKNCPCYFNQPEANCWADQLSWCENITDCPLKQIVELCKEVENIENVETLYDAAQSGIFLQANRILKLLDIEEVE